MQDYGIGGDYVVYMEGPFAVVDGGSSENMTSFIAPVANWKGAASPYSQVINIGQVNVNTKVDIQLSADQIDQLSAKRIAFTAGNAGGEVTLYAVGDKPPVDCQFQATLSDVINVGDGGTGVIYGNTVSTVVRLEPSLLLSGGKMEGNIDMDGNNLTNIRTPINEKDAANKKYVDDVSKETLNAAKSDAKEKADAALKTAKEYTKTNINKSVLLASGWSEASPYTQTITVEGLTDDLNAKAYPNVPDDSAEAAALAEETSKVNSCKRSGNQLTFRCLEDKPSLNIPVIVEVYA